jgi:hypothetical protein
MLLMVVVHLWLVVQVGFVEPPFLESQMKTSVAPVMRYSSLLIQNPALATMFAATFYHPESTLQLLNFLEFQCLEVAVGQDLNCAAYTPQYSPSSATFSN